MKICIIGNAHVASLQRGWEIVREQYPDVTLTFFAARGRVLEECRVQDGSLVAPRRSVVRQLEYTSGGLSCITPSEYDACLVYSLDFSLPRIRRAAPLRQARASCRDAVAASLGFSVAAKLRQAGRTVALYVAHNPLPAGDTAGDDAEWLTCAEIVELATSYRTVPGVWLVAQPEGTLAGALHTDAAFAQEAAVFDTGEGASSTPLVEGQTRYMNAAFGELWLHAFLGLALHHASVRSAPVLVSEEARAAGTDLEIRNASALASRDDFRLLPGRRPGAHDVGFQHYKNRYPYFGFVDVAVDDTHLLMFSANDDLVAMTYFWYGPSSYERMSLSLWLERARTARCVLDIGAFSGLYSLVAAAANAESRVFAFEPVRRTHGRLLLNVEANRFHGRVECLNLGVADQAGSARINQFRQGRNLGNGASILAKTGIEVTASDELIHLVSVDAFVRERGLAPDLVKMDVEGAELLALAGMRETLTAYRPWMLVEVTPETAAAVVAVLDGLGYDCQVIADAEQQLLPFTGEVGLVCNLLATPRG